MNPQTPYDLTRITLVVLIIGVLLAGTLWTLLPFLGALIWAATIVVATWPLLLGIQRVAGGRRLMATAVMTGVMLAIFIVPFWFAIGMLLDAAVEGVDLAKAFFAQGLALRRSGSSGCLGWANGSPRSGANSLPLAPRQSSKMSAHTFVRRRFGCSRSPAGSG
jgi:hypothetical protein